MSTADSSVKSTTAKSAADRQQIDSARLAFPQARLARIADAGEAHFWHTPRRDLILSLIASLLRETGLNGPLLDLGCGTGEVVNELLAAGHDAHGVDPWAGDGDRDPARFRCGTLDAIPWPDASVVAACAFDVIEHGDDVSALAELYRVLAPGGLLLLSVPAHAWLWSRRDELAGHQRRYSRRMLRHRVEQAGFEVRQVFGFQFLLLPLVALSRFAARRAPGSDTWQEDRPSPRVNRVLERINQFEVALGRWIRPPTGSSLFLVGVKPGAGPATARS